MTIRADYLYPGTPGGLGSFSYGDPSKVGPREARSSLDLSRSRGQVDMQPIVPGGGGGSKPVILLPGFGSRAQGCLPQGAVIIRLRKLT